MYDRGVGSTVGSTGLCAGHISKIIGNANSRCSFAIGSAADEGYLCLANMS